MHENKYLYLVFSSTKGGIGSFVRFMTGNFYNHVSVSLDPKLTSLYSFARRYKNFPFYGGFVNESCLRYQNKAPADIKVCQIKLSDSQYEQVCSLLDEMSRSDKKYIYNTISAIAVPLRRKVRINNAYTCVEFAVELLANLGVAGIDDRFYTIKQVEAVFDDHVIYQGSFPDVGEGAQWGNDSFPHRTGLLLGAKKSVSAHLDLLRRMMRRVA